ncbi:hypothetical protein EMEDMD4_520047 [Sinorhizobium medicae]|uniref:Uncharacterized protein n=1 Tax=Sinorhizobium medicae TaxID=110321 RepID=A0A508X7D0_9HYPH|nr:hypothetical protein EMEDMD4_520047 [Sinorhizobium medicae]
MKFFPCSAKGPENGPTTPTLIVSACAAALVTRAASAARMILLIFPSPRHPSLPTGVASFKINRINGGQSAMSNGDAKMKYGRKFIIPRLLLLDLCGTRRASSPRYPRA